MSWPVITATVKARCGDVYQRSMTESNFALAENAVLIDSFAVACRDLSECCLSASLLIDKSASTGWGTPPVLDREKEAAVAFVHNLDPDNDGCDDAAIVSFNESSAIDVPLTTDKLRLQNAIDTLTPGGGTGIWDAACEGVLEIAGKSSHLCRAVVVFSDGWDNVSSHHTVNEVVDLALANNVRIFGVCLGGSSDLRDLCERTFGKYYATSDPAEMTPISVEIALTIHQSFQECRISYRSSCPDGGVRNLTVILQNLTSCGGTDTLTRSFKAALDPSYSEAAIFRLDTTTATPDNLLSIPLTLENQLYSWFPPATFRIAFDPACCAFVGIDTTECLLQGLPITTQGSPGSVVITVHGGKRVPAPGILVRLLFRTLNPSSSTTSPLAFRDWSFTGGCLHPYLLDGRIRILVSTIPEIVEQPANREICAGMDAWMRVTVGSGPPAVVQWQTSGDGGASWSDVAGANQLSLAIPSAGVQFNGTLWRALLVGIDGDSVFSAPARLTISPPVRVVTHPADVSVCENGNALFSAGSDPFIDIVRRWQQRTDQDSNWIDIPGAEDDLLRLVGVGRDWDGRRFRIVCSDTCGNRDTSRFARLTVLSPPVIVDQPRNDSVCEGTPARFAARVQAAGMRLQWQNSTDGGAAWSDLPGETSDTLLIPAAPLLRDGELYRLLAMNPCDTLTSDRASLRVHRAAPLIVADPQPASACEGDSVLFGVLATEAAGYQWRKEGVDIPGAVFSSWRIRGVQQSDTGRYQAVVYGRCGQSLSAAAELRLLDPVSILVQPSSRAVKEGDSVRFNAAAAGAGLTFQWMKDGAPIPGANGSDYFIPAARKSDEGIYSVRVSGSCGPPAVSAAAQLSVTIVSAEGILPLPERAELYPNYPNPFAAATTIQFALPARQNIEISIHDIYGRKIETLAAGEYEPGRHALSFIANGYPAGMYALMLATERGVLAGRMTIVR